jgi:DNA segregation ATPase FtsK/SpoIIIE, S-DNA-T family
MHSSELIAKVALLSLNKRLESILQEEPFSGCFWILSGFSKEEIAAFVAASTADKTLASKLHIELPRGMFAGIVDEKHLVDHSAAQTRAINRTGRVILAVDSEGDVETTLNHKEAITADSLKSSDESAEIWVDVVCADLGASFDAGILKHFVAMIKGVFDTGAYSLPNAARYFHNVISNVQNGEIITKAAGRNLPDLGLPKYEACFAPLAPNKLIRSQWHARLEAHHKNASYLTRRRPDGPLLDPESLAESLLKLKESAANGLPSPTGFLEAVAAYVEGDGSDSKPAKDLFFVFDWSSTKTLFEKTPTRSSTRKFVEETKQALNFKGIQLKPDEETLLDELADKKSRKSGEASEAEKQFFEEHESIFTEHNPKLGTEWQDFVFEKKAICTDFLQGLFDCARRRMQGFTAGSQYKIVVEGKDQSTIAHFKELDPAACHYFERHYGKIVSLTNGLISFSGEGTGKKGTLLPNYKVDVWDKLSNSTARRRSKTKKKIEFRVAFYERKSDTEQWSPSGTAPIPLTWNFPSDSVPAQEAEDLAAILKHTGKKKSPLVRSSASYASVGKKGLLHDIDLYSTESLAPSEGDKISGRFIPSITKIKSIDEAFNAIINEEKLPDTFASQIQAAFKSLENAALTAIAAYSKNAMDLTAIPSLANAYAEINRLLAEINNDNIRKRLIQTLGEFGTVTVIEANRRPTVTIVCPWHPLRLEAHRARLIQITDAFRHALNPTAHQFSDGRKGGLFIKDTQELFSAPLLPDLTVSWDKMQSNLMTHTSHFGNYSIHHKEEGRNHHPVGGSDKAKESANLIISEVTDYLNLQPHERDNLAILLYNCDSSELPAHLVEEFNKWNRDPKREKVNCEILLTHRDEVRLQTVYQELVADSKRIKGDEREDDFLSRIRINLSAAQAIPASRRTKRTKPTDIAFCRDELSKESKLQWASCSNDGLVIQPENLIAHRWQRMLPFEEGSGTARIFLTCPAQTQAGWNYVGNLAFACDPQTSKNSAQAGKQTLPIRSLDFDNQSVATTIEQTHNLGVWVVNQDQLLDRRLLEERNVRVIRYVQSSSSGMNTVISSTARDTLLMNTIQEILRLILPGQVSDAQLADHARRFMAEANAISGKLVLRAARRSNNAKELMGVVLSKFLIESQITASEKPCWFLLDDYAHWLGKRDGSRMADLLLLSPTERDGKPHLEIAVTEAKFVTPDSLNPEKAGSEEQLQGTLIQMAAALAHDPAPLDQDLWLARLADMLLSRMTCFSATESTKWRTLIRNRECTFSLVGYSHVFCHLPDESLASHHKGVKTNSPDVAGHQEIFNFEGTLSTIQHMLENTPGKSLILRQQYGHPDFTALKTIDLSHVQENEAGNEGEDDKPGGVGAQSPGPMPDEPPAGGSAPNKPSPQKNPDGSITNDPHSEANDESETRAADESATDGTGEDPILQFLKERTALHTFKAGTDEKWLKATVIALQQALHRYGLSAKLADGSPPILTPNAALIRFQGGADLTINQIEKRIEELYTSDGLKILSLIPGNKMISVSVERPDRQILYSTTVFAEFATFAHQDSERVFIGIREEDGEPMFIDPFSDPHTLVAGATGSGKSVLVQNMLLHIALTRRPDQSHIYLIDGKKGVNYLPLRHLPHVKAGSGSIIDTKDGSVEVLVGLVEEMERRYDLFKNAETEDIKHFRRKTGKNLPTIWVIHDEFAEWMKDKDYAGAVTEYVDRLSIMSRGAGIFMIFCAQRPDNTVMPMQLRSQLGNRLVLKVSDPGTAEIATGEKNSRAEQLLKHGHMLARVDSEKVYLQVPLLLSDEEMKPLVSLLSERYPSPSKFQSIESSNADDAK